MTFNVFSTYGREGYSGNLEDPIEVCIALQFDVCNCAHVVRLVRLYVGTTNACIELFSKSRSNAHQCILPFCAGHTREHNSIYWKTLVPS